MKNSTTFAQQAKRIQNKYKGRTDKLSMDSMHRELAALEAQQEALRQQMNLDNSQEMYAWGGPGGYVNQPDNNLLAMGGLIKRADGSYSQRGLWDNIRANKGSGKKPTKQMLEQEKKIKQMAMGGYMYADGGNTEDDNNILPSWDAVKAALNPYNWGVTDYTDKGNFTKAYSSAKKSGESEFMYNNKRYNTKSDMNEYQQMKAYGITDKQRVTNPSSYRKNLSTLSTIDGYNTPIENVIDRMIGKGESVDFSNDPNDAAAKEQDALRLYLGLPQKANTFKPSKYKKGAFELNNYLGELPDIMPSQEEIDYYGRPLKDEQFKNDVNKPKNINTNNTSYSGNTLKPLEDFVMGRHTVKSGKDGKGDYIEYIDEFDFDTYKYNLLKQKIPFSNKELNLNIPIGDISDRINKPFSIYGRKYYKDYGDGKKKTMYYSDKELSNLDANKKNFDTLALQRELSNRGYKFSKSTKKDGTFDGIYGPETEQALLDYQNKLKTKTKTDKMKAFGGNIMVEKYADGGKLPKEILRSRVESHMSPEEADDYINEYGNGGYTVKRSSDRKGKTHVVIGPDGTKKYFGDSNLGQHPNDPARKKAFYARHKKNLAGNPYFRAFARKTWADGGEIDPMNFNYEGIAQAFDYGGMAQPMMYAKGGGIHIDPSKKGTFTAAATKHGKSVQGFASQVLANKENYSPAMVKKANFARNASKWHHAYGGPAGMYFEGPGDEYNGVYNEEGAEPVNQMMRDYFSNKYPSTTNTPELTIPNLKYQTQSTRPTLTKPFVKSPTKELNVPKLGYKAPNKSPFYTNYKSPFGSGTNMTNTPPEPEPKEKKEPFNYAGLAEFAGPLMDLYYGIKGPDQVNFDRVKAQEINLAPGVTADLIRRSYSPAIYAAKQQGLGQGSYLNMLGALSSEAGENVGKSYLQSKLAQEQYNAGARNAANTANAQIGMQESIARQQERDAARSAVTKGAGELGKGVATLSLDPRLETAQAKQNKIMRALIKSQNPALDIDSILNG